MNTIPQAAINGLLRLGFVFETGYVNTVSKAYGLNRKEYRMRHMTHEVYLLAGERTWFYDATSQRFYHPDQIHDHIDELNRQATVLMRR